MAQLYGVRLPTDTPVSMEQNKKFSPGELCLYNYTIFSAISNDFKISRKSELVCVVESSVYRTKAVDTITGKETITEATIYFVKSFSGVFDDRWVIESTLRKIGEE